MELQMGIGPMTSPLPRECSTTEPLELNEKLFLLREWSGLQDSNLRHPPWKGGALPTELSPHNIKMVERDGFEPSKACADRFTVCCL